MKFNFNSPIWKTFKEKILRRDSYTCQSCGGSAVDVTHVIPVAERRYLAYDENNILTICKNCM